MNERFSFHGAICPLGTLACIVLLAATTIARAQLVWNQSENPKTGKVLCLLSTSDGVLYAGTERGGVFRSTNGGDAWSCIALGGSTVYSLYKLGDGRLIAGLDYDVVISTDDGGTWTKTGPSTVQNVHGIVVDRHGNWYIGSWAGIHKSTDEGATWTECMSGLPNISVNALAADTAGVLYSAHQNLGLYVSRDEGENWVSADPTLEQATATSITIAENGTIFVGTMGLGVYRSTDGGTTWAEATTGLTVFNISSVFTRDGINVYAGTSNGRVFRSTNGGDSWTQVFLTPNGKEILSITSDRSGKIIIGTAWEGTFSSSDGGSTWNNTGSGFINVSVPSFAVNSRGLIFMVNQTPHDIMVSHDEGTTWTPANGQQYRNTRSIAVMSNDFLYAGTSRGVFHSTDDGFSWFTDTLGMYNRDVRVIAIGPDRNIYVSCFGKRLYRSNDYGQTWTLISQGLGGSDVISFAFAPDGTVFAGTLNAGLYRSTNSGSTWTNISQGLNRLLVTALCYSEVYGLYAGSYGEVYHSTDRGDRWTRITNDLPVATVNAIVLSPYGHPVVGMEYKGVYFYDPAERRWAPSNNGLFNPYVLAFQLTRSGKLLAGTDGNGVFSCVRVPDDATSPSAAADAGFHVSLYPNPVVSSRHTTATLSVRETQAGEPVRLQVTDALGRTRHKAVGSFDGRNGSFSIGLSSWEPGIYFYTVQSGGTRRNGSFAVMH
ncbi:MAG: T9SS type A sorting domain-containing protein [Bacteroidota bacterium]|nr:T9SS type A sorting domain-containing protein [Bacteroidota bacterium]